MAIVTCGPFMAQIARADTWKFLQTNLQYYIYLLNNYLKWLEQVSDHIPVSTCGSATCAVNGTHLTICKCL